MFMLYITTLYIILACPDINECMQTPGICGLGTCSNNDNGMFYECTCQNGTLITGTNTDGTLTCIGMLVATASVKKLLFVALWNHMYIDI